MLPHKPESLEHLRARYGAAVREIYDLNDPHSFTDNRPSDKPQHVFDGLDGLRLIISRERWVNGKTCLHLSASFERGSETEAKLRGLRDPMGEFRLLAFDRWRYLAGKHPLESRREEASFQGFSEGKGVPHWLVWDKEES